MKMIAGTSKTYEQPEAPGQCNTEECYYCPFPCERHGREKEDPH